MTTIRKNSVARIMKIVNEAFLITRYRDFETEYTQGRITADEVFALKDRWSSVRLDDDGSLSISICHHVDFISIYPSEAVVRKRLTAQAIEKYLGA